MNEFVCTHGLNFDDVESNSEINTYCASCAFDALYDGSLGISMGIQPDIKQRIRNKEKSNRKKGKLHG